MEQSKTQNTAVIRAPCPLYACRICRTKTGWAHQSWCSLAALSLPACPDCRYWEDRRGRCSHPAQRKAGETA